MQAQKLPYCFNTGKILKITSWITWKELVRNMVSPPPEWSGGTRGCREGLLSAHGNEPKKNNKIWKEFVRYLFLWAGLCIRIHLNPDPDPAFFVNPDPDPNQIRKPNPDPNPELDSNRIRIEKKGWIRIWIRIQMNPDPQPCLWAKQHCNKT
jgi:hypothetical protein